LFDFGVDNAGFSLYLCGICTTAIRIQIPSRSAVIELQLPFSTFGGSFFRVHSTGPPLKRRPFTILPQLFPRQLCHLLYDYPATIDLLVWPLGSAISLRSLSALRVLLALWTPHSDQIDNHLRPTRLWGMRCRGRI